MSRQKPWSQDRRRARRREFDTPVDLSCRMTRLLLSCHNSRVAPRYWAGCRRARDASLLRGGEARIARGRRGWRDPLSYPLFKACFRALARYQRRSLAVPLKLIVDSAGVGRSISAGPRFHPLASINACALAGTGTTEISNKVCLIKFMPRRSSANSNSRGKKPTETELIKPLSISLKIVSANS